MTKSDFKILLQKFGSRIQNKDTQCCEAFPAWNILAVTLRYLASGDYFLTTAVFTTYLCAIKSVASLFLLRFL
jgi:hypothetical protein